MRRLGLVLEYDGGRFSGFQRQPNRPTVQAALEARLSAVCGHPIEVVAAGRTDAGVHALGQVVHFDTTGRIPVDRIATAVNSLGGSDLIVRQVQEVPAEFHARFSAVRRTYQYFLARELPSPFQASYVVYCRDWNDAWGDRIRGALDGLIGTHDFGAFCAAGSSLGLGARGMVRTVFEAGLEERGTRLRLEFVGDAFLRGMVRMLVGALLEIGRERLAPDAILESLKTGQRVRAATAPAHGLFLAGVEYPDGLLAVRPSAAHGPEPWQAWAEAPGDGER